MVGDKVTYKGVIAVVALTTGVISSFIGFFNRYATKEYVDLKMETLAAQVSKTVIDEIEKRLPLVRKP